jgi:hypothetical protein
MYSTPRSFVTGSGGIASNASEAGITIRPVSGPAVVTGSPPDVFVYFWALQVDIRKSDGTIMGGGHFGVQWCNPKDASAGVGHFGRINWGCYDGFYTPDPNAVCRSSKFLAPFDQYGNFHWEYGWDMKFRVFKSPKQNWLAAELDPGSSQAAPYVGTDQQASETAWRVIMKINTDPWIFVRDVLVKNADGVGYAAIAAPIFWTEYIPWTTGADAWPGAPEAYFSEFTWDGAHPGMGFDVSYGSAVGLTHNNVSLKGNYISHEGNVAITRTVAEGSILTPPSGFYPTRPANVTPNPSLDPAARITTPRPWF